MCKGWRHNRLLEMTRYLMYGFYDLEIITISLDASLLLERLCISIVYVMLNAFLEGYQDSRTFTHGR